MTKTKILLGLGVMAIIQIGANELMSALAASQVLHATAQSIVIAFTGALAGGWVARRGFLLPALMLLVVIWAAMTYILYSIAAPTGQASVLSILQYNWVAIVVSGVATGLGAVVGQKLAGIPSRKNAAAT